MATRMSAPEIIGTAEALTDLLLVLPVEEDGEQGGPAARSPRPGFPAQEVEEARA